MHFTPKNTFYDIKPHHFKESTNIKVNCKNKECKLFKNQPNGYILVTYKMKVGPNYCDTLGETPHCNYLSIQYITHLIVVISALCP